MCNLGKVIARENMVKGIVKGRLEGKYKFAKAMIADGEPYAHLSQEGIERLMT